MLKFLKQPINLIIFIIALAGFWQFSSGSYIYIKAQVAQILLNNAWIKTVDEKSKVKPWDWADTYPIAKIKFPKQKKEFIVLAGGTGRTMAFGPGHISATPLPGSGGNSVIVGHRDTHFSVLEKLKPDETIMVQLTHQTLVYEVADIFVVDEHQYEVMLDHTQETLTLITCYPFNTLEVGGPLRYVVQAALLEY